MKYSLGWTCLRHCRSRIRASECLPVQLIIALIITGHLMVSCAELTKEGGSAPEDPSASAPGSPQDKEGDIEIVSGPVGGKPRPPSDSIQRQGQMDKTLLTSEYSSFDGDGLPGTQEEFKIEVPPAKEECFFQWMKTGTQFHSSFQVLRGADLNLDFTLRSPDGIIIQIQPWTSSGSITKTIVKEGVYALCLGNNMSKYSRKLVHVYFQTQLSTDWHNYTAAIVEYQAELLNMTRSLQMLQSRVPSIKVSQAFLRMLFAKDQYNVWMMKETVQKRSIVISTVIVVVALFQVIFLRRLFRSTIATSSAKPRA